MTSDSRMPPHPLAPGLYFVATPIGAARDITLRALDILATAEVLAAEDTRTMRHLMEIHDVALGGRTLLAYHDHNGDAMRPRLIRALAEGKSVAYASDAGTPLVADPGYQLARAAIAAGFPVLAAPGPSAVLAAL
ncbi:MAG: SAM-dependent methyltransferase, partial [Pseudorhodobacter sp.]|nr:SAM-dependent methyltransferase [Pseudorhodobacter sp.]